MSYEIKDKHGDVIKTGGKLTEESPQGEPTHAEEKHEK